MAAGTRTGINESLGSGKTARSTPSDSLLDTLVAE